MDMLDQRGGAAALQPEREVRLGEYISMLRRRIPTIVVCFLAVTCSTVFFVLQKPEEYESFSTLVLEESQSAFALAGLAEARRPMGFYRGILSSRSYLAEVLDSVGIKPFEPVLPENQRDTLSVLSYIKSSVGLGGSGFQSLMQFTARAGTKELAYNLAHHGTQVFRRRCVEVEAVQSEETVKQLEGQIVVIRQKLEEAEKDYQSYRDRTGLAGDGVSSELKNLQDIYFKERAERTLKKAEHEATKSQLELMEARIAPSSAKESKKVMKLREKLRELERQKRRLMSLNIDISPNSPLQKEINTIEDQILRVKGESKPNAFRRNTKMISQWQALRSQVASQELEMEFSRKRLHSYKRFIDDYKRKHPEILDQVFELSRLNRAKNIYAETYNILLGKAEEAKVRRASEMGRVKIIDPAYMPRRPVPKNEKKIYVAGALVGLLLGLGIAFFLEYNDTSIKSGEDIERYLGLPVIGTIPHIVVPKSETMDIRRTVSRSGRKDIHTQYPKNLIDFSRDESIASEAYRSLRTNLIYSSPDKPIRTMLFTSSGPGEGKSLTVANVALAYAQMGSRVVLVDTDLRRPVVHHLFQLRREPGFCELFLPNADWEEIIRPTKMENLSIIPAGRFTPSPAELIGAHKMDEIVSRLKERFDIVFFDTPPLVAVTDATVLSKRVDAVILVLKSRKTEREFSKRATSILRSVNAKIVGSVLNDIDLSHRYSSYGYYKYYYHYYRSQKD